MVRFLIILAGIGALTACTEVREARMALPVGLEAHSETLILSGLHGGNAGSYRLGAFTGQWSRSETRLALGPMVEQRGMSRFTLTDPVLEHPLAADCTIRASAIAFDDIAFETAPMAYRCQFTAGGRAIPARFELQQANAGAGSALSRQDRRGEIALDREIVQMRSLHRAAGGGLSTAHALGYVFTRDGHAIGALDLSSSPRLYLPGDAAPSLRRAISAAALALALLRDPAKSAL